VEDGGRGGTGGDRRQCVRKADVSLRLRGWQVRCGRKALDLAKRRLEEYFVVLEMDWLPW